MAQLALTLAGGVLGGAAAGGLGQLLGALFGAYLGGILDRELLGPQEDRRPVEGARIAEFNLSGSADGQTIPMIFGRMRVPANIIWVRGIREVVRTETETVGSGGGGKAPLSEGGFGREVREALRARVDRLASDGLVRRKGDRVIFAGNLLDTLRRRELAAAAALPHGLLGARRMEWALSARFTRLGARTVAAPLCGLCNRRAEI